MQMKRLTIALALALGATGALAQLADGEIRKVDRDAKKITIKHGEIKSLDMPAMTMVFRVRNAELLEAVKPGDKVKFDAQEEGGQYVVTRIERAK
jgi:Cu/Ag efflux protein CusF